MTRLPAAQRKEQLLEVASRLFAERGYAGATTAQLAREAGVTEPIIYRHFASKRDLFIALVQKTGEETIRQWEAQLAGAASPAEKLRRLVGANPMVSDRGRGAYRVIVQAMTEIKDEKILQAIQEHIAALHDFVTRQVEEGQRAGVVSRRFSPQIIAWLLLHLGLGYGVLAPVGVPGHARDSQGRHVREVVEQLLLGEARR